MEKERKLQIYVIAVLLVAVISMSIGFATYAQTLTINGTATMKKAVWSVHYDTTTGVTENSATGYVAATTKTLSNTDFTFAVTLQPGEKYEATFNVINDGTFAAYLDSLTFSTSSSDANYTNYTSAKITVDGTDYTANASNLNHALAVSGTNVIKVTVEYILPADSANLPSADTNVTISGSLDYKSVV